MVLGKSKKIILLTVFLVLTLCLSQNIHALGVAPSREIIDYKQGVQTINARIINNDRADMRLAVYAQGDLAEYAKISDPQIVVSKDEPEKQFSYQLDLPKDLKPGTHDLKIIVVQLPETFADSDENILVTDEKAVLFENKDKESMISATTAVIHQLQVRVPYPESFLEGRFYISEGKVGDLLTFTVPVVNRGTNPVDAYAEIVIKGPTNEEIASFKTDAQTITGGEESKLVAEWTAEVNQGVYLAEAIIHYGDEYFTLRKEMNVGNVFVSIEDVKVDGFKLGGIAKFDVDIKNKWNQEIKDVYGELKVLDKEGQGIANVKTLSTDLEGYQEGQLNAYWDTAGINVGSYDVNVILHYAGKTTEKLFQTVVGIDKITVGQIGTGKVSGGEDSGTNLTLILILLVAVLIIVNLAWFVFLRKRFKKPPNNQENPPENGFTQE